MCFFNAKSSFLLELLLDMCCSFYICPPYSFISLSYFYFLVPEYFIFGDFFSSSFHLYKSCLWSIPLGIFFNLFIFFISMATLLFKDFYLLLFFFVPSLSSFIIVYLFESGRGRERQKPPLKMRLEITVSKHAKANTYTHSYILINKQNSIFGRKTNPQWNGSNRIISKWYHNNDGYYPQEGEEKNTNFKII